MFEQRGKQIAYDGYGGPYNTELLGVDDEALVLEHPDIFQTYYYYPAEMPRSRYIFAVEAVDATGAGDCFGGAFVARIVAGDDPFAAARYANAAAALSTTGYGAVAPIPHREVVERLVQG